MADQPTDNFSSNPQETPAPAPAATDLFADQLKGITDPATGAQKYSNVDEALKGLANAQSYIPTLKSEISDKDAKLAELQAELDKRASVEDVVARITANQNQEEPAPQATPQATGLDEQAVASLVESVLTQKEQSNALKSNRTRVNAKLSETYGDKAVEVIAEKAKSLGTTPEELGNLAGKSPDLVLGLFGSTPSTGAAPTTTSINIPPTAPKEELARPEKSLLRGATLQDQVEYMRLCKEEVYRQHGITEV